MHGTDRLPGLVRRLGLVATADHDHPAQPEPLLQPVGQVRVQV